MHKSYKAKGVKLCFLMTYVMSGWNSIFQRYKDFLDGLFYEIPLRQAMMRRRFNTLMKHLEIFDVHFHTLRHKFATQAIEEGINPKTVSELLGLSSVSITLDRYVHPSEEEKRKCMNIYSSLL